MYEKRLLNLVLLSTTTLGGCGWIGEQYRSDNDYRRVHAIAHGSDGTAGTDLAKLIDPLCLGERRVRAKNGSGFKGEACAPPVAVDDA